MLTLCCGKQRVFVGCIKAQTSSVLRGGISWKDLLAVFPTGYGKSIVFHLLYSLLAEKKRRSGTQGKNPVVIVVSPLNSLIQDQVQKINAARTRAVVLSVKGKYNDSSVEQLNLDLTNVDEFHLKNADYEYVFTHPEMCLSTKQGVAMFQSDAYKYSVSAVVVDEAHCILEWYVCLLSRFILLL